MAYLSSHPSNFEVSMDRASAPILMVATIEGSSIHRSIMSTLASRPITNRYRPEADIRLIWTA